MQRHMPLSSWLLDCLLASVVHVYRDSASSSSFQLVIPLRPQYLVRETVVALRCADHNSDA